MVKKDDDYFATSIWVTIADYFLLMPFENDIYDWLVIIGYIGYWVYNLYKKNIKLSMKFIVIPIILLVLFYLN